MRRAHRALNNDFSLSFEMRIELWTCAIKHISTCAPENWKMVQTACRCTAAHINTWRKSWKKKKRKQKPIFFTEIRSWSHLRLRAASCEKWVNYLWQFFFIIFFVWGRCSVAPANMKDDEADGRRKSERICIANEKVNERHTQRHEKLYGAICHVSVILCLGTASMSSSSSSLRRRCEQDSNEKYASCI